MTSKLKITYHDPALLKPNDFNPNVISPENEERLENSVDRLGLFKPIIVRTLEDGTLEILGGEHRAQVAVRKGIAEVPIINLGRIDDQRAKEIALVDNGRYGVDDALKLSELLQSLDEQDDLASFLPYTDAELNAILASSIISLNDLELPEEDDQPTAAELPEKISSGPTHRVLRFKVPFDDADAVEGLIERVMKEQGFTGSDSLTNAGDALVWICNRIREQAHE